MELETLLKELGLVLPDPVRTPPGVRLPFAFVRVHGSRAYIAGHGPTQSDGTVAGPFGKVGEAITLDQAVHAARLTALAMLASLKRELGDLDRVGAWLRVFGMVNAAPWFSQQPAVINGFSDLILQLYGPERGRHERSAGVGP